MISANYGKISIWGMMAHEIASKLKINSTPAEFIDVFCSYVTDHSDELCYRIEDGRYIFGHRSDCPVE
jgi:hypothetical protein